MSNILIAYFSATGKTAQVASKIAEATGGKLFDIKPQKPYMPADLKWNDKNSRSSRENADKSIRPGIATSVARWSEYDVVFLGFPIWWHTCPNIVYEFVEEYDFAGKTVIPFATSGGSGIDQAVKELKAMAKGSPNWDPGRVLNNNPSQKIVTAWVDSLNLK